MSFGYYAARFEREAKPDPSNWLIRVENGRCVLDRVVRVCDGCGNQHSAVERACPRCGELPSEVAA